MREYKEMYKYEQYKGAHEFIERKLESRAGGLEGWASNGLLEIHATVVFLRSATGRIHTLQASGSGHEDPGESELPHEW